MLNETEIMELREMILRYGLVTLLRALVDTATDMLLEGEVILDD